MLLWVLHALSFLYWLKQGWDQYEVCWDLKFLKNGQQGKVFGCKIQDLKKLLGKQYIFYEQMGNEKEVTFQSICTCMGMYLKKEVLAFDLFRKNKW